MNVKTQTKVKLLERKLLLRPYEQNGTDDLSKLAKAVRRPWWRRVWDVLRKR